MVGAVGTDLGWTGRPLWVVALTFFLGWFLLETVFNWWAISLRSKSGVPLFPRFRENRDGDEWPADKYTILLREWLRSRGFERLQSAKANLTEEVVLRSSFYQNDERTIRLQIVFLPHRVGRMSVCFVLTTKTQEGERVVTDNQYFPFGGYYPDEWFIERRPMMRSLERLMRVHERRLAEGKINIAEFDDDEPIEDLNEQMRALENENLKAGFLIDPAFQEEYGRITWEGRYRIWKELFLINYFGRTFEYR